MTIPTLPTGSRQRGMATLTVSLFILLLMSLTMFQTSASMLFDIKMANNQYHQARALAAARGGMEYAQAWLVTGSNTKNLVWSNDQNAPSGNNQKATLDASVSTQSIGGYSVTVSLWQNSAAPSVLDIRVQASGDASASLRQTLRRDTLSSVTSVSTPVTVNVANVAPMVINGGISGVTGNPSLTAGSSKVAIVTSKGASQINTGSLTLSVGATIGYSAFTGTAWDYVFPNTTKAQMKAAADYVTIFYYDAAIQAPNNWHADVGTASKAAILVFDTGAGCPKINGNPTIYGIVYYADDCSDNGWGGATINGSLVSERSITKLTANSQFNSWTGGGTSGVITLPPIITSTTTTSNTLTRLASWRDF